MPNMKACEVLHIHYNSKIVQNSRNIIFFQINHTETNDLFRDYEFIFVQLKSNNFSIPVYKGEFRCDMCFFRDDIAGVSIYIKFFLLTFIMVIYVNKMKFPTQFITLLGSLWIVGSRQQIRNTSMFAIKYMRYSLQKI